MTTGKTPERPVTVRPLTPARWPDLEALFGARGACAGCWCMFWRQTQSEFLRLKGEGNRRSFRQLVESGANPGLIAYAGRTPVGWCALAPREDYTRLERSRILAPVDDTPVWSVVCFFVARQHRRRGITTALLRAAGEYAKRRGARILEGYPVEPAKGPVPDVFVYTGIASAFRAAGFEEAARRSKTRPIMRLALVPEPGRRARVRAGAGRRGSSPARGRAPKGARSTRRG